MVDVDWMRDTENRRQAGCLTNEVAGAIIGINADFVAVWPVKFREDIKATVTVGIDEICPYYPVSGVFLKPQPLALSSWKVPSPLLISTWIARPS